MKSRPAFTNILVFMVLSCFLKIPFLTAPLGGYFGAYQTLNAMMSQRMMESPQAWLLPQLTLLQNGQPALHLLYYPFAAAVAAIFKSILGETLEFWGRAQAMVFMGLNTFWVFRIARRHVETNFPAVLAAFLFAFAPLSQIEGITFQNEAIGLLFLLLATENVHLSSQWNRILGGFLFSLSLIARFHYLVFFPALFFLLWKRKTPLGTFVGFCLAAVLPCLSWFLFFYFSGKHHADQVWIGLYGQIHSGEAWQPWFLGKLIFYRRILEIIAGPLLTPVLLAWLGFKFCHLKAKEAFYWIWIGGGLLMIVLFPHKIVDHPFYLLPVVPGVAWVLAPFLMQRQSEKGHITVIISLLAFVIISTRLFFNVGNSFRSPEAIRLLSIGNEVRRQIPENAYVIAESSGTPELLYYTQRRGWVLNLEGDTTSDSKDAGFTKIDAEDKIMEDIEKYKKMGATYLILSNPDKLENDLKLKRHLNQEFQTLYSKDYLFYRLSEPPLKS